MIKNRTYLWLYLVFGELRKSLKTTTKGLLKIVDEIPESVDQAYENILNWSTDRDQARALLSIILAARRPLTTKKIDVALALAQQEVSFYEDLDLDGKNMESGIRNLRGLFVYVADSKVFLLHQTAKEFLMKEDLGPVRSLNLWRKSFIEKDCNLVMLTSCLRYLHLRNFEKVRIKVIHGSRLIVEQADDSDKFVDDKSADDKSVDDESVDGWSVGAVAGDSVDDDSDEDVDNEPSFHDFFRYSADYWLAHFRDVDVPKVSKHVSSALVLINPSPQSNYSWMTFFWRRAKLLLPISARRGDFPVEWTVLQWAAFYGIHQVAEHVLDYEEVDVNQETLEGERPLLLAIQQGHLSMVETLLKRGADVNFLSASGTALMAAISTGNEQSVRLLLHHKADVNMRAGNRREHSALQVAASRLNPKLVELLLESGANKLDDLNGSLRAVAGPYNHVNGADLAIIKFLFDSGADDYNGALVAAAKSGRLQMVRFFVENGADDYNAGLMAAAEASYYNYLQKNLFYESKDDTHDLYYSKMVEIVEYLIERGAEDYNSALKYAARGRNLRTVEILIRRGADDLDGALEVAAIRGNEKMAKALLTRGAAVTDRVLEEVFKEVIRMAHRYEKSDGILEITDISPTLQSLIDNGGDLQSLASGAPDVLHAILSRRPEVAYRILKKHGFLTDEPLPNQWAWGYSY